MVTNSAGSQQFAATRFQYAMDGRTMTFSIGETWNWDGNPTNCPTSYAIPWAREFRYGGARARYLNRQLDPVALLAGNIVSMQDTWTDYDGDQAYGDYELTLGNPPTVNNKRSYRPGMAVVDPWTSSGFSATDYLTTDHLGTTRGLTIPGGAPDDQSKASYTAFGERISGENHRFGYIGQFGYQAHSEMPYLHVGARYYDPASGRFLQRDPIGIRGGINVYGYVLNKPTIHIDSNGLYTDGGNYELRRGWTPKDIIYPDPAPPSDWRDRRNLPIQSYEDMEQEMFERNIDAIIAGLGLGAMGIAYESIAWWMLGLDGACGFYSIWPF
jgi:RHS repeat-associated protein